MARGKKKGRGVAASVHIDSNNKALKDGKGSEVRGVQGSTGPSHEGSRRTEDGSRRQKTQAIKKEERRARRLKPGSNPKVLGMF